MFLRDADLRNLHMRIPWGTWHTNPDRRQG
jgi:hypothetical protein